LHAGEDCLDARSGGDIATGGRGQAPITGSAVKPARLRACGMEAAWFSQYQPLRSDTAATEDCEPRFGGLVLGRK
jgi:hypothetical protein